MNISKMIKKLTLMMLILLWLFVINDLHGSSNGAFNVESKPVAFVVKRGGGRGVGRASSTVSGGRGGLAYFVPVDGGGRNNGSLCKVSLPSVVLGIIVFICLA
ncbi:hypothetical protein R6Q59_024417 [Mikania micrantha]